MLEYCDLLEKKLTQTEKKVRNGPLAALRKFVRATAKSGGIAAPLKKSFSKSGSKDIRIDLEVIKGTACVPK